MPEPTDEDVGQREGAPEFRVDIAPQEQSKDSVTESREAHVAAIKECKAVVHAYDKEIALKRRNIILTLGSGDILNPETKELWNLIQNQRGDEENLAKAEAQIQARKAEIAKEFDPGYENLNELLDGALRKLQTEQARLAAEVEKRNERRTTLEVEAWARAEQHPSFPNEKLLLDGLQEFRESELNKLAAAWLVLDPETDVLDREALVIREVK